MFSLAFKMLIGNRAACIGVIFGVFLATLLISQQSAIFLGLITRSYRLVTDISEPTIWVIDSSTESEDKLRTLPLSYLGFVRSVPGVAWAVPLNASSLPLVTTQGFFDICQLYGVDDATLIGAPTKMVEGSLLDLRRQGAVIIDRYSAATTLAKVEVDGSKTPLQSGDTLEINGRRAVVVGICEVTRGFYPQPIIFTTLSQFKVFNPGADDRVGYILVDTKKGADVHAVMALIDKEPPLKALTRNALKDKIVKFFLQTGILINFGLSVLLGVIIGFSIAGQVFYMMTIENLVYFALIKAVGGTKKMILQMIVFQALLVGAIGYTLGIGVTVLWGMAIRGTTLAFLFPWELLLFTASIVLVICIFTTILSVRKVLYADPKILMGT